VVISLIRPCWPTNISRIKLIIPIHITGVTSTPPIGGIIFLVNFRIELVGNRTIIHNPFDVSIFGYQDIISLMRKAKVSKDSDSPKVKFKKIKNFVCNEITIL